MTLARATGDHAFWLDADDVIDSPEREKSRQSLGSRKTAGAVAGNEWIARIHEHEYEYVCDCDYEYVYECVCDYVYEYDYECDYEGGHGGLGMSPRSLWTHEKRPALAPRRGLSPPGSHAAGE